MPAQHTDHATDLASLPYISDDECVMRLAEAVEAHDNGRDSERGGDRDSDHLDEVALLIGRLAVPIEI
jgi:hypothetical protein